MCGSEAIQRRRQEEQDMLKQVKLTLAAGKAAAFDTRTGCPRSFRTQRPRGSPVGSSELEHLEPGEERRAGTWDATVLARMVPTRERLGAE
jgi:hypothetical protein